MAAESIASAWGQAELVERHHLFSARGSGVHLDRNVFDRHLSCHANAAGSAVHRDTQFRSAAREGGKWHIQLSNDRTCKARFLIDATGRSASVARLLGAHFRHFDRLTAYTRFFDDLPPTEHRTIVEACALGWWYTAPLPHRRRVVSLLTDSDLAREIRLPGSEAWYGQLLHTRHVAALFRESTNPSAVMVTPASTALLSDFGEQDWLATGDAAMSCDPLAGQGITSALRSGILASYAAADALYGKGVGGLQRYEAILRAQFGGFTRSHRAHHAYERRWIDQPFWQRRQGGTDDDSEAAQAAA